jgi:hypothetical protein
MTAHPGYIYFFETSCRTKVKIGWSRNPTARIKNLSITDAFIWRAAVPGMESQEAGLHRHFRDYQIRREMFRLSGELEAWLRLLDRQPWAAHQPEELSGSYAPPDWLPWEDGWHPSLEDQMLLPVDGGEWGRVRAPSHEDAQVLAGHRSDTDDWWTPSVYIEAARTVLREIDLDPASSPKANEHIQAKRILTARENGLTQPWHGRVWLNPPYGGQAGAFMVHLLAEYEAGRVTGAIALINAWATEALWFAPLWRFPICFAHHRIEFRGPAGQGGNSTHGGAFVYMGPDEDLFAETFSKFGVVVKSVTPASMTREEFRRAYPDIWDSRTWGSVRGNAA